MGRMDEEQSIWTVTLTRLEEVEFHSIKDLQ